ncbi:MAG: 50S ribosomal protein L3 [Deltaproteobacteria bacterium]|nr:50S ribosomal protein L3 [Deltaproteobacteria bacterium]
MNTNIGLIGKKLGNSQIFLEDGNVARVTVIQVGPCLVLGKRTAEKDGYTALILGFGKKRSKLVNKPLAGFYAKNKQEPAEVIREFRLSEAEVGKFEVGQQLKPSDCFGVGQKVDVSGISRGRGFSGVVRRWNMPGAGSISHGAHEYKRHVGSIGCNMTPGRTLRNKKLPGQYGNERVTVLNLEVAKVIDDPAIILLKGAVPGARNGVVSVRIAVMGSARAA